jgi:hypothetical protein
MNFPISVLLPLLVVISIINNMLASGFAVQWAEYLVTWLVDNCEADTVFWALNVDSVDTGGLFARYDDSLWPLMDQ